MGDGRTLTLGIDLGTTSVKVCLVNKADNSVVRTISKETKAGVPSDVKEGSEQDPCVILQTVHKCLSEVPEAERERVVYIGVTGQMHGLVMWSDVNKGGTQLAFGDLTLPSTSRLYTWQDQRCSPEFLSHLPTPNSHLPLSTGHGCATIFWLCRNKAIDSKYECCGTIMDLLVAMLCGLSKVVTTPQLAASFGYFNCKTSSWNTDLLSQANFPTPILPEVVNSGQRAGTLQSDFLNIRKGTTVLAALGDVQCAVFSVVKHQSDAVLNMSTSSQVMFPTMQQSIIPDKPDCSSAIQLFPYFDGEYLVMAASLNGGNVLASFVSMLQQWMSCLDLQLSEDEIWKKLLQISVDASVGPVVSPKLYGERHTPDKKGEVTGLTNNNLDLASIFRSVCRGLVKNLCDMMPLSLLQDYGIKTLITSGSVMSQNPVVKQEVEMHYGNLEIKYGDICDSALGAALYCVKKC